MMRRSVFVGLGLVTLASVVGCTPQPAPPTPSASFSRTPWVMPAVVGDIVSSSPLEADEWVIAMRKADLGSVFAFSAADFSIEPFRSTSTPERAESQYEFFLRRWTGREAYPLWPGPSILLPLEVDVTDEDHASVRFCDGSDYWIDEDESRLQNGVVAISQLVRTDDGIREHDSSLTVERCDATGAPIARFDPALQPLGPIAKADVVPPEE